MLFNSEEGRDASRALAQFGSMGIALALGVVAFWWIGSLIDRRLGCEPIAQVLMCLLGSAAALYKLVRDVSRWDG